MNILVNPHLAPSRYTAVDGIYRVIVLLRRGTQNCRPLILLGEPGERFRRNRHGRADASIRTDENRVHLDRFEMMEVDS